MIAIDPMGTAGGQQACNHVKAILQRNNLGILASLDAMLIAVTT